MKSERRTASLVGWLFIATFVFSIPAAFIFYAPVLDKVNYIVGEGGDAWTSVSLGALFEMIVIIANIGTALVLFPILKRENETVALGYVRPGSWSPPSSPSASWSPVGRDIAPGRRRGRCRDSLFIAGRSLVAVQDWTFVLGPGFVVGMGNGLMLGYLLYASGLVPRRMAVLGLIGGPLMFISGIAVLFGVIEAGSVWQSISTVPEILWESSLGIYLIVKGFRPSPITADLEPSSAVA